MKSTGLTTFGQIMRSFFGLDFHVLMTLLFRSWAIFAGAGTVVIIPFFLTPVEQGYYFTFASMLGMQILFELGLSQVVVQLVGHDVAHLRVAGSKLEGDVERIDRLASLVQLLRKWYLVAAMLFAMIAGSIGLFFLGNRGQLSATEWAVPWIMLVLGTSANLAFMPALALMEGTGKIGNVARLRLLQSAIGYVGLWMVLFSGGRLWAVVVMPFVSASITSYWLYNQGALYHWLRTKKFQPALRIDWRKDVLPFQWRIAASWISGYFIFYTFTPLIFMHQGATEAGRFGIALTIFNAVSVVGMSWVNAMSPKFGMHISLGERSELNGLFAHVFKRSIAFTSLGSVVICASAYMLTAMEVPLMHRVAEPAVIACLGAVCIINCAIFSMATYMRAHREEPMLPVSVASGIATALIAYFGSAHDVLSMSVSYLVMNAAFALPLSAYIFIGYYRRNGLQ